MVVVIVAVGGLSAGCKEQAERRADQKPLQTTVSAAPASGIRLGPPLVCKLRPGTKKLPASRRRGLIDHLLQYPDVTLATPGERARAERALARLVSAAKKGDWADVRAAESAGYDTRTRARERGDDAVHYFHAERPQEPRGRVLLDTRRPKALIYANAPGQPLVLVGAMWSMRDGERGPNPGGPITRWHSHVVCKQGTRRGLKPPASGKCPPGSRLIQGRSEMLHVWFTGELRSAFAIRAPEPELCAAGLLPQGYCLRVATRKEADERDARSPLRVDLVPTVEAAFAHESYAPGDTARLVVFGDAARLRLQVFHSGPERLVTRRSNTMHGVRVTPLLRIGSSSGRRVIRVRVGDWASGLYFVRLRATDGRIGFAPFVVRPRQLGEHRVAVVLPTLTWQAYNLRDDDGDGQGDSWYADWSRQTVRLGRPHLNGGVPYGFRNHLPFLQWLERTGREVDVLSQSDLEAADSPDALRRAYDLIVFPGHHEYVTTREYDLIKGYRDHGGNLMFLSANNFYWQVIRRGDVLTRTRPWRELGRPEAALIGVQYIANSKVPRNAWIVRRSPAASWIFAGTGLRPGSALSRGGVEIDKVSAASPRDVQVLAEIPDLFGPGKTAQMTYYEARSGARVFAAGAFHLTRVIHRDPRVAGM
ncbi:MAG: N,N-dimethylformamidase beta subunit family domain-containing protein, partial [Gaiellaceae bacterium]